MQKMPPGVGLNRKEMGGGVWVGFILSTSPIVGASTGSHNARSASWVTLMYALGCPCQVKGSANGLPKGTYHDRRCPKSSHPRIGKGSHKGEYLELEGSRV